MYLETLACYTEEHSHSSEGKNSGPLESRMIIPRKKALDYFSLISPIGFLTRFTFRIKILSLCKCLRQRGLTGLRAFCRWDFTFWIPSSQITLQKGLTALFIQYVKIKPVKRGPQEFSYFWVRKSIKLISETTYHAYRYNVEGRVPTQLTFPSIFPFELLTQSWLYLILSNWVRNEGKGSTLLY